MADTEKIPVKEKRIGSSFFYSVPVYWSNPKVGIDSDEKEFAVACGRLACRKPLTRFYGLGAGSFSGYAFNLPVSCTLKNSAPWWTAINATASWCKINSCLYPAESSGRLYCYDLSFSDTATEKTTTAASGAISTRYERSEEAWDGPYEKWNGTYSTTYQYSPTEQKTITGTVTGRHYLCDFCGTQTEKSPDCTSVTCSASDGTPEMGNTGYTYSGSATLSSPIAKATAYGRAKANAQNSNLNEEFTSSVGFRISIDPWGDTSVFLSRQFTVLHDNSPRKYFKVWLKQTVSIFVDGELFNSAEQSRIIEQVITTEPDACAPTTRIESSQFGISWDSFNLQSYISAAYSKDEELDVIGSLEVVAWSFVKDYTPPLDEGYPYRRSGFPPYKDNW
jgi:hypothetical protein